MFGLYFVFCFFLFNLVLTGFHIGMQGEPRNISYYYKPMDAILSAIMSVIWGFVAYSLYLLI
jgi:hypothetical protein